MHVLVVDDSDLARMMLMHNLDDFCTCDEARDGVEAFDKYTMALATGVPHDLVFMDVIMPNMDGIAALKAIRSYEESAGLPRTPVCMVSANDVLDEVAGLADGFLPKPFSSENIQHVISNLHASCN